MEVLVSNVVKFVNRIAEWHLDLDQYEEEIKTSEKFSEKKGLILVLLMETASNEDLPKEIRHRACRIIWKHSEVRQFLSQNLAGEQHWHWNAEAMQHWYVK